MNACGETESGILAVGLDQDYLCELLSSLRRQGIHVIQWWDELDLLPCFALSHREYQVYLLVGSRPDELAGLCRSLRHMVQGGALLAYLTRPRSSSAALHLLEAGADECVFQPSTAAELAIRLRTLSRWVSAVSAEGPAVLRSGALSIYPGLRAATLNGRLLELSRREFCLLCCLAEHPRTIFTLEELQSHLSGELGQLSPRQLRCALNSLREKLGGGPPSIRSDNGLRFFCCPSAPLRSWKLCSPGAGSGTAGDGL